jgi:hypothetical protein
MSLTYLAVDYIAEGRRTCTQLLQLQQVAARMHAHGRPTTGVDPGNCACVSTSWSASVAVDHHARAHARTYSFLSCRKKLPLVLAHYCQAEDKL